VPKNINVLSPQLRDLYPSHFDSIGLSLSLSDSDEKGHYNTTIPYVQMPITSRNFGMLESPSLTLCILVELEPSSSLGIDADV